MHVKRTNNSSQFVYWSISVTRVSLVTAVFALAFTSATHGNLVLTVSAPTDPMDQTTLADYTRFVFNSGGDRSHDGQIFTSVEGDFEGGHHEPA